MAKKTYYTSGAYERGTLKQDLLARHRANYKFNNRLMFNKNSSFLYNTMTLIPQIEEEISNKSSYLFEAGFISKGASLDAISANTAPIFYGEDKQKLGASDFFTQNKVHFETTKYKDEYYADTSSVQYSFIVDVPNKDLLVNREIQYNLGLDMTRLEMSYSKKILSSPTDDDYLVKPDYILRLKGDGVIPDPSSDLEVEPIKLYPKLTGTFNSGYKPMYFGYDSYAVDYTDKRANYLESKVNYEIYNILLTGRLQPRFLLQGLEMSNNFQPGYDNGVKAGYGVHKSLDKTDISNSPKYNIRLFADPKDNYNSQTYLMADRNRYVSFLGNGLHYGNKVKADIFGDPNLSNVYEMVGIRYSKYTSNTVESRAGYSRRYPYPVSLDFIPYNPYGGTTVEMLGSWLDLPDPYGLLVKYSTDSTPYGLDSFKGRNDRGIANDAFNIYTMDHTLSPTNINHIDTEFIYYPNSVGDGYAYGELYKPGTSGYLYPLSTTKSIIMTSGSHNLTHSSILSTARPRYYKVDMRSFLYHYNMKDKTPHKINHRTMDIGPSIDNSSYAIHVDSLFNSYWDDYRKALNNSDNIYSKIFTNPIYGDMYSNKLRTMNLYLSSNLYVGLSFLLSSALGVSDSSTLYSLIGITGDSVKSMSDAISSASAMTLTTDTRNVYGVNAGLSEEGFAHKKEYYNHPYTWNNPNESDVYSGFNSTVLDSTLRKQFTRPSTDAIYSSDSTRPTKANSIYPFNSFMVFASAPYAFITDFGSVTPSTPSMYNLGGVPRKIGSYTTTVPDKPNANSNSGDSYASILKGNSLSGLKFFMDFGCFANNTIPEFNKPINNGADYRLGYNPSFRAGMGVAYLNEYSDLQDNGIFSDTGITTTATNNNSNWGNDAPMAVQHAHMMTTLCLTTNASYSKFSILNKARISAFRRLSEVEYKSVNASTDLLPFDNYSFLAPVDISNLIYVDNKNKLHNNIYTLLPSERFMSSVTNVYGGYSRAYTGHNIYFNTDSSIQPTLPDGESVSGIWNREVVNLSMTHYRKNLTAAGSPYSNNYYPSDHIGSIVYTQKEIRKRKFTPGDSDYMLATPYMEKSTDDESNGYRTIDFMFSNGKDETSFYLVTTGSKMYRDQFDTGNSLSGVTGTTLNPTDISNYTFDKTLFSMDSSSGDIAPIKNTGSWPKIINDEETRLSDTRLHFRFVHDESPFQSLTRNDIYKLPRTEKTQNIVLSLNSSNLSELEKDGYSPDDRYNIIEKYKEVLASSIIKTNSSYSTIVNKIKNATVDKLAMTDEGYRNLSNAINILKLTNKTNGYRKRNKSQLLDKYENKDVTKLVKISDGRRLDILEYFLEVRRKEFIEQLKLL